MIQFGIRCAGQGRSSMERARICASVEFQFLRLEKRDLIGELKRVCSQPISIGTSSRGGTDRNWGEKLRKIGEYYHPLDDYSGDDLEAAENSWSDDMARMIEGN